MKKLLIYIFIFFIGLGIQASETDIAQVRQFFDSFVKAANSYSDNYFNFYEPNAKIVRVVVKKDGSKESVAVPMSEYKKQSGLNMKIGKLRKYSNSYSDINITETPEGDYEITALRKPSTSDYKLPVSFVIGKDSSGSWKIKSESMETKVQAFLKRSPRIK